MKTREEPRAKSEEATHRGMHHDRTEINDDTGRLEKALAEKWESINRPDSGLNYGHGALQDLFMRRVGIMPEMLHEVTDTERMVVATVVQWLGSNVGRGFLYEAFRQAGWSLSMTPHRSTALQTH